MPVGRPEAILSVSTPSALGRDPPYEHSDADRDEIAKPALLSDAGLEALYRKHASRLMRRFAHSVGPDDAIDLVHEAFARLAGAKSPARETIECPEAFVTTVATNVLRDRARAAARRALQERQLAQELHEASPDPHRLFESREALRAIERALTEMNSRRRKIFVLHRFEQLTYAEIGHEVGMSEKGVKKQMAKALVELRRAAERPA